MSAHDYVLESSVKVREIDPGEFPVRGRIHRSSEEWWLRRIDEQRAINATTLAAVQTPLAACEITFTLQGVVRGDLTIRSVLIEGGARIIGGLLFDTGELGLGPTYVLEAKLLPEDTSEAGRRLTLRAFRLQLAEIAPNEQEPYILDSGSDIGGIVRVARHSFAQTFLSASRFRSAVIISTQRDPEAVLRELLPHVAVLTHDWVSIIATAAPHGDLVLRIVDDWEFAELVTTLYSTRSVIEKVAPLISSGH